MEIRRVGRSGLEVSRLGLGTMTWGRDTDVDTANIYGDGDSESILGTLVPDVIARRDVVLATTTVGVGGGRGRLLGALSDSLGRLDTGSVDLWLVHGYDDRVPLEETCSALRTAVETGRAAYVGVSGYSGWQLATAATWLRTQGCPMVAVETEYSLVERSPEESLLPAAAALGVGVLAWAPLGRGVLTGKYRHGTPADSRGASPHFARYVGRHLGSDAARIVQAVVTAAEGLGISPLAVAFAWVRDRPGVASTIVGARDNAQLLGSLAAIDVTLPGEIRAALEDVSSPAAA